MDRFLIAPFETGLETDLKPWMIPDEAFASLQNAYVWRGRVRKRFGGVGSGVNPDDSRVAIQIGTTDGSGNISGTVPGNIFKVGQQFLITGATTGRYTVYQAGVTQNMLKTDGTTTATYSTTNGAYNFVGAPINAPVYFYPSEPIMGLTQYETNNINLLSYAFDTQFAYLFSGTEWLRSGSVQWNGQLGSGNSNFFWSYNWTGQTNNIKALFVSNFQVTNINGLGVLTDDPIWSMTRSGITDTWTPFSYSPSTILNAGNLQPYTVTQTITNGTIISNYVQTARIVIPFKGRLLLLNTVENNANGATAYNTGTPTTTGITPTNYQTSTNASFVNRCRYSHVGSPFSASAWLEPNFTYKPNTGASTVNADGGGFIDAATDEAIIGAEFIKDRLIVYFENSTWELAYTGNQVEPFSWQKINTELGAQSTFSTIPFDKAVLAVGDVGVHSCTGANVTRIDEKIPTTIFDIRTDNNGVNRVAGIRDYFLELAYWTYPDINANQYAYIYPNKVLAYNYRNNSWAIYDDTITAFGYLELNPNGNVPTRVIDRQIITGNQQGYIAIIHADIYRQPESLQITNIAPNGNSVDVTVIDHTLDLNDFVLIENAQGTGVGVLNGNIFKITNVGSTSSLTLSKFDGTAIGFTGPYTGGGTLSREPLISIISKQWNPYVGRDRNIYLAKIDFGVLKTTNGQVQVDYYPSSSALSMITAAQTTGTILGSLTVSGTPVYNALETKPYTPGTLEDFQTLLWHPIYFQTQGNFIQILISLADAQICTPNIAHSDFQLEGMVLYTEATTQRLQ